MEAIKARIQQLHNTEAVWNSTKYIDFIPRAGELIIYDADEKNEVARFKFGNGKNYLRDLPFVVTPVGKELDDGIFSLDAGRITEYELN